MAFKDTYRLEKVYYENIWTLLKLLKNVDKNNVDMGTVKELLDNAIADNESIIIIYKNLGELYAELQNQHMELGKELEKLKDSLEEFKDEINDKIDENHNYIMGLIREIEQRLDDLENRVEDLEERMTQAETDIDSLEGRMTTAEGDIDNLETAVDGLHDDLTALDGRVDTAEGDIDDLEQNKQDKLTAGSGIAIDENNVISSTAGSNPIFLASNEYSNRTDRFTLNETVSTKYKVTEFVGGTSDYYYGFEYIQNLFTSSGSLDIFLEKIRGKVITFQNGNIFNNNLTDLSEKLYVKGRLNILLNTDSPDINSLPGLRSRIPLVTFPIDCIIKKGSVAGNQATLTDLIVYQKQYIKNIDDFILSNSNVYTLSAFIKLCVFTENFAQLNTTGGNITLGAGLLGFCHGTIDLYSGV